MAHENPLGVRAGHLYIDAVQLLERERELETLLVAVRQAAAGGQGAGFALTGDSGAGKSALVEAVCAEAGDLRVLRGHCDPLNTPRPLGPFRDLAVPGLEDIGQADLLLSEVCEQVYAALRTEPTVLVVEDLHWVDAASVDVLRFLVRRLETMACAIVVTYRDDEITAQHSARPLLGDFAAVEHLSTLRLAPLSVAGVAE